MTWRQAPLQRSPPVLWRLEWRGGRARPGRRRAAGQREGHILDAPQRTAVQRGEMAGRAAGRQYMRHLGAGGCCLRRSGAQLLLTAMAAAAKAAAAVKGECLGTAVAGAGCTAQGSVPWHGWGSLLACIMRAGAEQLHSERSGGCLPAHLGPGAMRVGRRTSLRWAVSYAATGPASAAKMGWGLRRGSERRRVGCGVAPQQRPHGGPVGCGSSFRTGAATRACKAAHPCLVSASWAVHVPSAPLQCGWTGRCIVRCRHAHAQQLATVQHQAGCACKASPDGRHRWCRWRRLAGWHPGRALCRSHCSNHGTQGSSGR